MLTELTEEWARERLALGRLGDARKQRSAARGAVGVVYFIHAPAVAMVKIGVSRDLEDRLAALRMMSPTPLVLLTTMPGGRLAEAKMHQRFAKVRSHGEWFCVKGALAKFLSGWLASQGDER